MREQKSSILYVDSGSVLPLKRSADSLWFGEQNTFSIIAHIRDYEEICEIDVFFLMLEMICIAFVNTLYYFCIKTKILIVWHSQHYL